MVSALLCFTKEGIMRLSDQRLIYDMNGMQNGCGAVTLGHGDPRCKILQIR